MRKSAVERILDLTAKVCKWALILLACWLVIGFIASPAEEPGEPEGLEWVREESRLVDYEINDDRITVRYSVRMVNHDPDVDWELEFFALKFTPKAVTGWLKYEDSYNCTLENGDDSMVLKGGETKDVILVFEGEYFHGEVPEDLPVPLNLLFAMSDVGSP